MCGGGGGGGAPVTHPEAMPPVSQEQINAAVSLPEGFTATTAQTPEGWGYFITDPSGQIHSQSQSFGDLLATANQLDIVGSASEGIYDPTTRQFINRTTGQVLDPTTAGQVTGTLAGRQVTLGRPGEYQPGIGDLARGLMEQEIVLPEQRVAQFAADQQRAFELARQGVGSFQPFLQRAEALTEEGVGALQSALGETRALAGQIPGVIDPGRAALERAALGVEAAAGRGETAAQRAATGAEAAAGRGEAAARLAATGVAAAAGRGVTGADIAAERARASTAEAQRQLQEASAFGLESARAGIAGLAPGAATGFMSPFEEAAVQQALADIGRQGELAQQEVRGQAVRAGAFGGSRQAVAEQELQRNILEQQARTAAQLRAAGFESAANRALQAAQATGQLGQIGAGAAAGAAEAGGRLGLSAEQLAQASALQGGQLGLQGAQTAGQLGLQGAQLGLTGAQTAGQLGLQGAQLGLQGAQAAGNLGLQSSQLGLSGIQAGLGAQQQAAGLGQGIAGLGQQFVGLGQAGQQMNLQDVNTMLTTGMQQQRQEQAVLDAARANQMQTTMQPFQQLAFASDIIQGLPSGQTAMMTQPGPSVGSQLLGLGVGAYGLSQAAPSMFGGRA